MLIDMHTHTTLSSCSVLDIHDMIGIAKDRGLDGFCVTDHHTMDIRHYITEGIQKNGVTVIFGMEYDTPDGDFLIFGPYERIPQKMQAKKLLNHIKNTGGIAIAAHPFRKNRPVTKHLLQDRFCTMVESINGRNSDIENLNVKNLTNYDELTKVGGSDAHTADELGNTVTHFPLPIRSRQDLLFALTYGLCQPERHHPLYSVNHHING